MLKRIFSKRKVVETPIPTPTPSSPRPSSTTPTPVTTTVPSRPSTVLPVRNTPSSPRHFGTNSGSETDSFLLQFPTQATETSALLGSNRTKPTGRNVVEEWKNMEDVETARSNNNNNNNNDGRDTTTNRLDNLEENGGKDPNNHSMTCCDALVDCLIHGPCPPINPKNIKVPWQWYHSWYPTINLRELFIRERDTDMNILDGVRALAYLWVLNDHMLQVFDKTLDGFELWFSKQGGITYVQTMEKGDQGVTSFFVLSGFLIPFILTRQVKARKERFLTFWAAVDFLFHRWIRLAPTLYAATIVSLIYGYYTTSSFAKVEFYDGCKNYWWTNILFLNDFSGGLTGWADCYDSVWTISVEMQLYILTLPVVYYYVWEKEYGYVAAIMFTVISLFIRLSLAAWIAANDYGMEKYAAYVYLPPWSRAAEYGVGMILFMIVDLHLLSKKKPTSSSPSTSSVPVESVVPTGGAASGTVGAPPPAATTPSPAPPPPPKSSKDLLLVVGFWIFIVFAIVFAFFFLCSSSGNWFYGSGNNSNIFLYYAMSYFIWGVGLAAIIYVSLDPPFWPLAQFLSLSIWYPIAQLAYSGGVLNIMICSMYSEYLLAVYPLATWSQSVNYFALAFIFLQVAVVSLAAGVLMSLLIERPFMQLGKMVKF